MIRGEEKRGSTVGLTDEDKRRSKKTQDFLTTATSPSLEHHPGSSWTFWGHDFNMNDFNPVGKLESSSPTNSAFAVKLVRDNFSLETLCKCL